MRLGVEGWSRNARSAISWSVLVDAAGRAHDTIVRSLTQVRWTAPYPEVRSSGGSSSSYADAVFRRLSVRFVIEDQAGNFVARVDFAYPDLKIIECDRKKHHFGRGDWERDVERRSRLAALGWLVIHVSWDMLVNRPDELEALISGALGQPSLLDP